MYATLPRLQLLDFWLAWVLVGLLAIYYAAEACGKRWTSGSRLRYAPSKSTIRIEPRLQPLKVVTVASGYPPWDERVLSTSPNLSILVSRELRAEAMMRKTLQSMWLNHHHPWPSFP